MLSFRTHSLLFCALVSSAPAFAVSISLDLFETLPGNQPAGTYTSVTGTSTWSSQVSKLSASDTAANVAGSTATVSGRYAFSLTSFTNNTEGLVHSFDGNFAVRATVTITNDDPNPTPYALNLKYEGTGWSRSVGNGSQTQAFDGTATLTPDGDFIYFEESPQGQVSIGGGLFQDSFVGLTKGASSIVALSGTHTFNFDLTGFFHAETTSNFALGGGLNGTNPFIGASQVYPGPFGHTDPAADGFFFTATVTAVPEPSTLTLTGFGALALLIGSAQHRKR